ncbi:MAG: CoA-binding protein [Rhizobiales bacterium]|nr:CoA-binding protein [Hyphomicrobiales bacterium]
MTIRRRTNLERLLAPRHIAFIGGRDAAVAIGEARRIGFGGALWPVNPKREQLAGIECFPSIDALPEAPDAVFLAVPVPQAIDTVAALSRRGTGGIVCYTAGFGEAGSEGIAAERALVEAAGDMALIGPNCYGVINYLTRTALWPFAHGGETPGHGAAIITQSGMLSSDLTMSQRSAPLTHMISIGNQAVVTIEDLLEVLCEKEEVCAVGLHIEGLRDVRRFAEIAVRAAALGKPIVALKTGSSAIGGALTSSHTGSLSGEDDLYDALFQRCGVIRVREPDDLLETLKLLCVAGAPRGPRIAGFTCSGGGATMLADLGDDHGLAYPEHAPAIRERLAALLPPIATVSNPLDYTTPIWGQPERTGPVFRAALEGGCDVALLVQDYPAAGLDESRSFYLADGDAFADAVRAAGVPGIICSTLPENIDPATRRHFRARGIAPMQGIGAALRAIAAAVRWRAARARLCEQRPAPLLASSPCSGLVAIDEADAKAMLAEADVCVPRGVVSSGEQASAAAGTLGFPVALKMLGADILHKTELGAVALGLRTGEAVSAAVDAMKASVRERRPASLTDRFLVERMEPEPLAELIVSVRSDAAFGQAMTIGSGGVLVELIGDSVTLLLPSSPTDIADAIAGLRASRLLGGFRGRPTADLMAIAREIAGIAQFARQNAERLAEIEINPLFVHADRVCAVDALIHLRA